MNVFVILLKGMSFDPLDEFLVHGYFLLEQFGLVSLGSDFGLFELETFSKEGLELDKVMGMIVELEDRVDFTAMFMNKVLLVLDYPSIISWNY